MLKVGPVRRLNHEGLGLQAELNSRILDMSEVEFEVDTIAGSVLVLDFPGVPFCMTGV